MITTGFLEYNSTGAVQNPNNYGLERSLAVNLWLLFLRSSLEKGYFM
jgi:hypothetical protein